MAKLTTSDMGSVAARSTANAIASCVSRNSRAASRQVPSRSGISASATVSAPKSMVPGKPVRSMAPARQTARPANTSATYGPIEMRKSSARTGRKSARRVPARRFCLRPSHSISVSDRGSISAERFDCGDACAVQLCGDIGFRALSGDFRGIDPRNRGQRPPQDQARHVGYFRPAAPAPLDAGEDREQVVEAFGPAQGVAMLEQRKQVRRTQRGSAPYRLAVPPGEQGEVAAVAWRLEALAQGARRLDGERAASNQSATRREAPPLGGSALECADENAGGIVRRAAVIECEVQ